MKYSIYFLFCLLTINYSNCFSQQSHFWTTDVNGERLPKPPYKKEGVAFYAQENGIPIYRWIGKSGTHFWTTDINGEGLPKPEFRMEGIAFYGANVENGIPVYRWVANNGNHFWTTDANGERLPKHIYKLEGVAFYGAKSGVPIYRFVVETNPIQNPLPQPSNNCNGNGQYKLRNGSSQTFYIYRYTYGSDGIIDCNNYEYIGELLPNKVKTYTIPKNKNSQHHYYTTPINDSCSSNWRVHSGQFIIIGCGDGTIVDLY